MCGGKEKTEGGTQREGSRVGLSQVRGESRTSQREGNGEPHTRHDAEMTYRYGQRRDRASRLHRCVGTVGLSTKRLGSWKEGEEKSVGGGESGWLCGRLVHEGEPLCRVGQGNGEAERPVKEGGGGRGERGKIERQ